MAEAIGIRMDTDFLQKVDTISKEEGTDRSTILRKLLNKGFHEFMKEKAKEKYVQGKITLSAAAKVAGLTIWEMQEFLVSEGYKSDYSIKDLEEDMAVFERIKKR